MKRTLLCMGLLAGGYIHAQQTGIPDTDKMIREKFQQQQRALLTPFNSTPSVRIKTEGTPFQVQIPEIVLANGNRLRILSGDHMPCVIPAPATAGLMPNAGNSSLIAPAIPAQIPNPGRQDDAGSN